MPPLSQTRRPLSDNYQQVEPAPSPSGPIHASLEPVFNSFLRCPLPPVAVTPDSLRQYYRGGIIPQSRLMTPTTLSASPTGSTVVQTVVGSTTSGTTGGTTGTSAGTSTGTSAVKPVTAQNASVTTPVLSLGDQFFSVVTIAKTFELLQVATSSPARVRLYATAIDQMNDAPRPDTSAPLIGTTQGLIADVTLDTPPLIWAMTWVPIGSNGDFPRTNQAYCTIESVNDTSVSITATLLYLQNE